MLNESSFEIETKTITGSFGGVLVKLILNQLGGCSQPQAVATPSFFPGSMRLLLGLSIDAQSVSKFLWKGGEHL